MSGHLTFSKAQRYLESVNSSGEDFEMVNIND